MANGFTRLGILGCIGGVLVLCAGCGIDVKLRSTPEPVVVGGLLTYTIDLTNNTGCDLNNVALMLMPLMPVSNPADFLNSDQCLNPFTVVCNGIPGLCTTIGDSCGSTPTLPFCQAFCASVPEFCGKLRTPDSVVALQEQVAAMTLDDILNALPAPIGDRLRSGGLSALIDIVPPTLRKQLTVGNLSFLKDKLPPELQARLAAPQATQPLTIQSGNVIQCGPFTGTATVDCPIGNLAKGGTVQVTIAGHPNQAGVLGNVAAVMGDPVALCEPDLAPDGGACSLTTVVAGRPAPAVSAWGLAALALLLVAVGLFYVRHRRLES